MKELVIEMYTTKDAIATCTVYRYETEELKYKSTLLSLAEDAQ